MRWGVVLSLTSIPFLFVLSIVVFFHEFGHFIVARLCGVKILVFSIGFGPELVGFNDRYGTRWKISAVPLGGYVKFFGDENAASAPDAPRLETMSAGERAQSFFFQPCGQACRHCGGRPGCQFRPGNRHFFRDVHGVRQAIHERARRFACRRAAPPQPLDFKRAIWWSPSMASRSKILPTCNASSARALAKVSISRSTAPGPSST